MPLSPGQVLNNRYRIIELLGEGGFGAVYRAADTNLEEEVAVKESLDTSPEAQKQFQFEARLLFRLHHASLPRVHDFFVVPAQGMYLVMDFIAGEDLNTKLEKAGGPLPAPLVLRWIEQVSQALEYLHSQNPPVIHRDIKPANIKINPQGNAVLVDFGIAKLYDPGQHTALGARALTYGYSPPEQYGKSLSLTDARSDEYALAATLYHLLTGVMPPESLAVYLKTEPPAPPAHLVNPLVPVHISQAIERAMQGEKERRFASVTEFRQALFAQPRTAPVPLVAPAPPLVAPAQAAAPAPRLQPTRQVAQPPGPASLPTEAPASPPGLLTWAGVGVAGLVLMALVAGGVWLGLSWLANRAVDGGRGGLVVNPSETPFWPTASSLPTLPVDTLPPPTDTLPPPTPTDSTPRAFLPAARLAFVSGALMNEQLYIIEIEEGNYTAQQIEALAPFSPPQPVALPGLETRRIWWPEWCLDNNLVFFEVQYADGSNLQRIGYYTFDTSQVGFYDPPSADYRELGVPVCAWDGRAVLFSAHHSSGDWHLLRFDFRNPAQAVQSGMKFAGNPAWGPDNTWIVFMGLESGASPVPNQKRANFGLFRMFDGDLNRYSPLIREIPQPGGAAIPASSLDMLYPSVNPRDGSLVFACHTDTWNVCVCDAEGNNVYALLENLSQPDDTQLNRVTPTWSPDGQWIAYMALGPENDLDIYLYSLVFGQSFNLTAAILDGNQLQPRWSK